MALLLASATVATWPPSSRTSCRGELTTRFLLKVFTVLVIAGGIFWYYLFDLKSRRSGAVNRHWVFASAAALAVVAAIALGLWSLGGPGRQREIGSDERRAQDLQNIANAINGFYATEKKLPQDLEAIRRYYTGWSVRDPITGTPYEYRSTGETQYELAPRSR